MKDKNGSNRRPKKLQGSEYQHTPRPFSEEAMDPRLWLDLALSHMNGLVQAAATGDARAENCLGILARG